MLFGWVWDCAFCELLSADHIGVVGGVVDEASSTLKSVEKPRDT